MESVPPQQDTTDVIPMASPEDMQDLLLKSLLPYNLVHDVNISVQTLIKLTSDFSEVNEEHFFAEPSHNLQALTMIYYILLTKYDDNEEQTPLEDGLPVLVGK